MEGPLQLLDSGKAPEMFVILFDDMLLITRKKKGLSKKVSLHALTCFSLLKFSLVSILKRFNILCLKYSNISNPVDEDSGYISGKTRSWLSLLTQKLLI